MISTELQRIQKAKADIKTAIEAKGVSVPPDALLSTYPSKIAEITGGGTGRISVRDSKIKFAHSDFTEIPSIYDFTGVEPWEHMFENCHFLTKVPQLDTSLGFNFQDTFYGCANLETIPLIDVSNGVSFIDMFHGCGKLNNIPLLVTSKGTDFNKTFASCRSLSTIPQLDLHNGKDFTWMFLGCKSLTSVPPLNTSNGEKFTAMFQECTKLTTVQGLDLTKAQHMNHLFSGCTSLVEVHFTGGVGRNDDMAAQGMFKDVNTTGTLYIPTGKRAEYENIINELPSTWTVVEG